VNQRKICKVDGCKARAWQRDYCNRHALERHRSSVRPPRPSQERLAEGRRLLRQRARELGIVLANDPGKDAAAETPVAPVAPVAPILARGKVRSPVG